MMWVLRFYRYLNRVGTWPLVALLVVVMLVASQGFTRRHEDLGSVNQLLDGRRWYTPGDVQELFTSLDHLRYYYAITEITLDLVYPLTYGALFLILMAHILPPRWAWLILAPILAVVFDLLENSLIVFMALTFNGGATPLAWAAAVFTLLKSIFFIISLIVLINAGFLGLVRARQRA